MILQGDTLLKLKELLDNSIEMGVKSHTYNKQENKNGSLVSIVKYDFLVYK